MARVCIIREVEVECAIDAAQTATFLLKTDLPGDTIATRHTEVLTGTGSRKVYRFRVAGTITGRMLQCRFTQGATGFAALYRIRLYLRTIGTPAQDWHWFPMPVIPTNEEWSTIPLPIPPTPEEWSTIPLPVPQTPENWSTVPLPIPPTPEEWITQPLPIKPANSTYQWLPVPVEET